MNITDAHAPYADKVCKLLLGKGFRVYADLRNEKVGYKIREHTLQRVPYLLVVGERERDSETVAVRTRSGEDLGSMAIEECAPLLSADRNSVGPGKEGAERFISG